MSEESKPAQQDNLNNLKVAHDYYATAIQTLTTRVQYYHEEFEAANSVVFFLRSLRDQMKAEIEKIEPPVAKEPSKPYIVDVPNAQPEASI